MKKIIAALALLCVFAVGVFGQMLNTRNYLSYFSLRVNEIADSDIVWEASDEEIVYFGTLNWDDKKNDDTVFVDTPLEFALLSYYSQPVLNIRPAEADAILPANNPKLADQKLGAAVFQEIQILRFLNASGGSADTAAVNRHEAVLQFITGRGNATRAEIEAFYRNNIRALIAGVVDEEFNKVSFVVENFSANNRIAYNSVLIRNPQTGQYILSYERPSVENDDKTLTAASLEALSSSMRNSGDFVPAAINTVRAQAALIPAVALSDAALGDIKNYLTAFYIEPNTATYNAVKEVYELYTNMRLETGEAIYELIRRAYVAALADFNSGLANKVVNEARLSRTLITLTRAQQQRLVGLR